MNPLSCESVTDLLPHRMRNNIREIDRLRVDRHLERCASCRAQSELVGLVSQARPAVPAGLHERVASAAAARHAPRRHARAAAAAAAGIVLALMTGGLLVWRVQSYDRGETPAAEDLTATATIQAVRPDDALLAGGPEFARLSVEELATLLAEMDQ